MMLTPRRRETIDEPWATALHDWAWNTLHSPAFSVEQGWQRRRWPTEVGLRGYPAVQTIMAARVDDQRNQAMLNLLFGDAARGLDQLGRRT